MWINTPLAQAVAWDTVVVAKRGWCGGCNMWRIGFALLVAIEATFIVAGLVVAAYVDMVFLFIRPSKSTLWRELLFGSLPEICGYGSFVSTEKWIAAHPEFYTPATYFGMLEIYQKYRMRERRRRSWLGRIIPTGVMILITACIVWYRPRLW